jgi:transcriptional regulator with XRE-family HTH domain
MSDYFLTDPFEDERPLSGSELTRFRTLAGLSRSELEKRVGLSPGRVRAIENGYLRLHRWESAKVKRLLLEVMETRAREIAEFLRAGGPALTENRESSP